MPPSKSGSRWYPTPSQLKDPVATERAFRQLLDQHYALQEQVNALTAAAAKPSDPAAIPSGSGPSDSMLLGLRVAPIDTASLADGTKLTYVKKSGNFQFL